MSEYKSVGYSLELMFGPDGVEAELFAADEPHNAPIAVVTAATADEAVRDLIDSVTFEPDDPAPNGEVLVAWDDIVDSFLLAMHAEGIDHDTRARIVTTVRDAVDNNS